MHPYFFFAFIIYLTNIISRCYHVTKLSLNRTNPVALYFSKKTNNGWVVVLGLTNFRDSISVYIGPSPREREKEEKK